jgi:hypothetical protein
VLGALDSISTRQGLALLQQARIKPNKKTKIGSNSEQILQQVEKG